MLVLLLSFIALALADYVTDLKINQTYIGFIQHFERFVQKTTDQAVLEAYEAQINDEESSERYSMEVLQHASSNITLPVIFEFRPIAYKIIYDAGYNRKGNYYIYDNHTKNWHLPYREASVNPINGTLVNSQILGQELQNAFLQLMSTTNPNSKLQKRRFGLGFRFNSATSKSSKELIDSLSSATYSQKVSSIHEELKKLANQNSRQADIDRKYLEAQMKEARLRQLEVEQELKTMAQVKHSSNDWLDLSWKNLFKHNISKLLGVFLMLNGIIALFSILFKRDDSDDPVSNPSVQSDSSNTIPVFEPQPLLPAAAPTNSATISSLLPLPQEEAFLPKEITHNGILYYLDESSSRYYYVDPLTNTSVWYSAF